MRSNSPGECLSTGHDPIKGATCVLVAINCVVMRCVLSVIGMVDEGRGDDDHFSLVSELHGSLICR